jgi:hypothetical protein
MHAQLEALLISSLVATAHIVSSPNSLSSHTHSLHITLCNNGPIALPELFLHVSSPDDAAITAGILPPPPQVDQEHVGVGTSAGLFSAINHSLLQASASARTFKNKTSFCSSRRF